MNKEVREVLPEVERRKDHLKLIPDTHPLKLTVLQCLKKENERPPSLWLNEKLCGLKESTQYTESMHNSTKHFEQQSTS